MPFHKPIVEWEEEDLLVLVDGRMEESTRIEYKREIDLTGKGKKEAAKDISAMANAEGGLIIYGIDERSDGHGPGIPERLFPMKDVSLVPRLEAVLIDSISPRVNFRLNRIDSKVDEGFYVVISVSPSYETLHMVTIGGDNRYYKRRNHISSPMTEDEVRHAYERIMRSKATLESRVKQSRLLVPDGWLGMQLLTVPFVHFDRMIDPRSVTPRELEKIHRDVSNRLREFSTPPYFKFGPDAFVHGLEGDDLIIGIRLLYNGGFSYLRKLSRYDDELILPSLTILECVHDQLLYFGSIYHCHGYHGPVHVRLMLHNSKGTSLGVPWTMFERQMLKRDELEISVETDVTSMINSTLSLVREIMDYLFISYGMRRCFYFDEGSDTLNDYAR